MTFDELPIGARFQFLDKIYIKEAGSRIRLFCWWSM